MKYHHFCPACGSHCQSTSKDMSCNNISHTIIPMVCLGSGEKAKIRTDKLVKGFELGARCRALQALAEDAQLNNMGY